MSEQTEVVQFTPPPGALSVVQTLIVQVLREAQKTEGVPPMLLHNLRTDLASAAATLEPGNVYRAQVGFQAISRVVGELRSVVLGASEVPKPFREAFFDRLGTVLDRATVEADCLSPLARQAVMAAADASDAPVTEAKLAQAVKEMREIAKQIDGLGTDLHMLADNLD